MQWLVEGNTVCVEVGGDEGISSQQDESSPASQKGNLVVHEDGTLSAWAPLPDSNTGMEGKLSRENCPTEEWAVIPGASSGMEVEEELISADLILDAQEEAMEEDSSEEEETEFEDMSDTSPQSHLDHSYSSPSPHAKVCAIARENLKKIAAMMVNKYAKQKRTTCDEFSFGDHVTVKVPDKRRQKTTPMLGEWG